MGVVYRAIDTRLNRQVAVKVLPAGVSADAERRRRFLHEAKAAAAVTHARIATVHDVGEADGTIFIVMELVQGESLRSLLRDRPLTIPHALRIAAEIADGLAHAHEAHIVHRDLKPENVVIDKEGHVKILDFGLARLVEERPEETGSRASQADTQSAQLTREGQILGTVAYMSPEQARGATAEARSDLFSLGIVLYEMVTGKRPFKGATPIETLSAILKEEPAPASSLNAVVPAGLDSLIARCLQKDPVGRYPSAAALREDLERLRSEGEAPGHGARPAAARLRRLGSRPALVWAGGVMGVAVAVVLGMLAVRRIAPPAAAVPDRIESLAVLPLRNLSGDPEQEYFADGMTDELITHLSRIRTLRVISRSSSMRYKGTSKPAAEIARELRVQALVEGSVQRAGDRVRVSASLVEAATDSSRWAESYERDLRDVLAIQSEVAGAIAKIIQARLTPQEEERVVASRPVDPEAFRLTLKGRHEWSKFTDPALREALEFFREALDHDPGYSPAYHGIADAYYDLSGIYMNPRDALPKARVAALKAIELDDRLAEAHVTLATVLQALGSDLATVESAFRRALELNPSSSLAHNRYGIFLSFMGRTEEAIDHMRQAEALDPLSPYVAVGMAWPFVFAPPGLRDYDQAVALLRKTLELTPDFLYAHMNLALVYSQRRQCDLARAEAEKVSHLSAGYSGPLLSIASVYATCGDREKARAILDRADAEHSPGYQFPVYLAIVHAALGDSNAAFRWLEVAEQQGDELLLSAAVEPRLDGLRSDPRFIDLLRRLKLPAPESPGPR